MNTHVVCSLQQHVECLLRVLAIRDLVVLLFDRAYDMNMFAVIHFAKILDVYSRQCTPFHPLSS